VCAVDLSSASAEPTELAARLAVATRTPLHLVHVTGVGPETLRGEPTSEADRVFRERLEGRRAAAAEGLERARVEAEKLGPPALSVLLEGRPWEALVSYAERCEASLVCVGPHGHAGPHETHRRGFTEWILGSTADRVLRHASCPVLVAMRHGERASPLLAGTWLVAIDFSAQSVGAAKLALELARACASTLIALHVVADPFAQLDPTGEEEPFPPVIDLRHAALGQRSAELEAFVKLELGDGVETRVAIGEPSDEIAEVAREVNARVVVMGTHGRTGLTRLLLGSTAERTLRRSTAPVLCVRS